MPPSMLRALAVLLVSLLSGCASTPRVSGHTPVAIPETVDASPPTPVVRYGRYTLVEMIPTVGQKELLQQVVDLGMPSTLDASVGDGMRHALLRSGYRLCDDAAVDVLDTLPLPAAHYHLGPLPLRDALQILAGPAWRLRVDDRLRQVCFGETAQTPSAPAGTAPAAAENRP